MLKIISVPWKTLKFVLEPRKPWETMDFKENLKNTLENPGIYFIYFSIIFSFLSLRLESCFIYYPVI